MKKSKATLRRLGYIPSGQRGYHSTPGGPDIHISEGTAEQMDRAHERTVARRLGYTPTDTPGEYYDTEGRLLRL